MAIDTPPRGATGAPRPAARLRSALIVMAVLVPIYASTAAWSGPYHIDPLTNAITGWYLAATGSPVATESTPLTGRTGQDGAEIWRPWIVQSRRGPVSQYPPGAALSTVPFYVGAGLVGIEEVGPPTRGRPPTIPLWPATLAAVLATAGCAAAIAATISGDPRVGTTGAVAAGLVAGLATSAWSVASGAAWTHGPAMLAVAVAAMFASRDRWWLAGAAYAASILCRPHLAVCAAVVGLVLGVRRRQWAPVIGIGAPALVGLLAVLLWNAVLFGTADLNGGYGDDFMRRALSGDWAEYAATIRTGLFNGKVGLLVHAPFLLVVAPTLWHGRRSWPDWGVASALGGVAYLLLQWKANRASGGGGFYPYRYPLEALAAAAPLLVLAGIRLVRDEPLPMRIILAVAIGLAITTQVIGVVTYS